MKRIYVVGNKAGGKERLIKAASRIQAENFVAREEIAARVASQDDLVGFLSNGVKVENVEEMTREE